MMVLLKKPRKKPLRTQILTLSVFSPDTVTYMILGTQHIIFAKRFQKLWPVLSVQKQNTFSYRTPLIAASVFSYLKRLSEAVS